MGRAAAPTTSHEVSLLFPEEGTAPAAGDGRREAGHCGHRVLNGAVLGTSGVQCEMPSGSVSEREVRGCRGKKGVLRAARRCGITSQG